MHADELYSGGPETAGAQLTPPPPRQDTSQAGPQDPGVRPVRHAWWAAVAWVGGAIALFAVLLRISNSFPMDSDGANNALQAWDILHGNVLMHGWIIGDATYYTFELPLTVLVESIFGLSAIVAHIESALVYVILAACAIAVARTGSRGLAVWIRAGVVVAVLAAPLLTAPGVSVAIEKPDHTGTAALTLLCFLIIDRLSGRLWMPVLLCVILILGQVGDATVLYVTVPAVVLVSLYRIIFRRNLFRRRRRVTLKDRFWVPDVLTLVAAGVSVPLADWAFALIQQLGGYSMIAPKTGFATSWSQVGSNFVLTGHGLRYLFGAYMPSCPAAAQGCSAFHMPGAPLGIIGAGFGWLCIAASLYGFGRVVWRWGRASRADQLLCVAIVANIAAYAFSGIPVPSNERELIAVVPFSAVLAARALVPERIQGAIRARVMIAVSAVAVVLPLAGAATVPTGVGTEVPLTAWLEAHHLKYGLGAYWNASAVTLQSGGRVDVRAVKDRFFGITGYPWETKVSWYDPRHNYANFVIANVNGQVTNTNVPASVFEKYFGRPASIHYVSNRLILIYHKNLLRLVAPPQVPPANTSPTTTHSRGHRHSHRHRH
jgi:hypothetical protein